MRGLTIQRTLVLVLFALIFAMAARVPVDSDMWWHLRSGEAILGGSFIREDSFSHTMTGAPWVNHSWGAQVIMTVLWQAAGSAGLAFYMAALATGGMVFVWLMARGNPYVSAFALIIGAAAAAVFWSPRPQMLSFFFSAASAFCARSTCTRAARRSSSSASAITSSSLSLNSSPTRRSVSRATCVPTRRSVTRV